MHVLAIEPCYGGSHRAFLDALVSRSRHRWTLATLPARHWKWRMRSAPVAIGDVIGDAIRTNGRPDRILLRSFLDHSRSFLARMPDSGGSIDLGRIESSSQVIAPGFPPPAISNADREKGAAIRLGWIGRMEHDKRPDRFLKLLDRITEKGQRFELILLGERGRTMEAIDRIRQRYGDIILWDGYAPSRAQYESLLIQIDVVVSTADHEFFGIALCEAIWSGAIPVTPNGLSYTDYIPDSLRYDSIDQAAEIISRVSASDDRSAIAQDCRRRIHPYRIDQVVDVIDEAIERLRLA